AVVGCLRQGEAAHDDGLRRGVADDCERRRQSDAGGVRAVRRGGREAVRRARFERLRAEIAKLAAEPDTFWTDQFHNTDALNGYADIGRELYEQADGRVDVFCGAGGTGGMPGCGARALREAGSRARIVALEPTESPAMTQGRGGAHRVEGIATGSIPPHVAAGAHDAPPHIHPPGAA